MNYDLNDKLKSFLFLLKVLFDLLETIFQCISFTNIPSTEELVDSQNSNNYFHKFSFM